MKCGVDIKSYDLANYDIEIEHFKNKGLIINKEVGMSEVYSLKNILFRNTKIIDGTAFGLVIETGNDCEIYRINNNISKRQTDIQRKIVNICLTNLFIMLVL